MSERPESELCEIREILERALREDVGAGDVTTETVVPPEATVVARYVARAKGVLAGGPVLEMLFGIVDSTVTLRLHREDGSELEPGTVIAEASGRAASILEAERVSLNLISRLSGIATLTRRFADAVRGTRVCILDTRKTTPGLRILEKYAVRVGGGKNHRMGLYDQILVKDNHISAVQKALGLSRSDALREILRKLAGSRFRTEVEVWTVDEARLAAEAGPDIVMLDNMSVEEMRRAVVAIRSIRPRTIIEASGGVTLETIREIAATGVDWVSIGALTHSAPALDISLEFA